MVERPGERQERDTSVVLWLGLPLASLAMRFAAPLLGHDRWYHFSREETGFVELVTVLMLLAARAHRIQADLHRAYIYVQATRQSGSPRLG